MAVRAFTEQGISTRTANTIVRASSDEKSSPAVGTRPARAREFWLGRNAQQPLVLFLCRSNAASSIMAEAILQHLAEGRVLAASAGDVPDAQVNPYAFECLHVHGVAMRGLRCKGWGEFLGAGAPPVRFLITLADVGGSTANWDSQRSRPIRGDWAMTDPATVAGSDVDIRLAFEEAFGLLESRVRKFLALPLRRLTDRALARELALIGQES